MREWVVGVDVRRMRRGGDAVAGGPRFAFYGRMSTTEFQDEASSRGWQREAALELIDGYGAIVLEYFDAGCSRRLPWWARPQASRLLEAAADPDRGFDAVVVGEYERAFGFGQLDEVVESLQRCGLRLWLPEVGGPVDLDSVEHRVLMRLLGTRSQREVLRARYRTLRAMCDQTVREGRYLGGRPPYGYRLVDAGPHPNPAHARWGRRIHRLEPDPVTSRILIWIFATRLTGRSVASIARELNERGVLCPSRVDVHRNVHRFGCGWTQRTVAEILANPRYTGRQVWNRHASGRQRRAGGTAHRTRPRGLAVLQQCVISRTAAHPPLVSETDFLAAQGIRAARPAKDGTRRTYLLAGLVACGVCGRRMDSHWVHGRPGYRCRHGHTTSRPRQPSHPRNLYIREDHLLAWLASNGAEYGADPQSGNPGGVDSRGIAMHLYANNLTVTAEPNGGWTLTRSTGPIGAIA